jgi:hypothetical protein
MFNHMKESDTDDRVETQGRDRAGASSDEEDICYAPANDRQCNEDDSPIRSSTQAFGTHGPMSASTSPVIIPEQARAPLTSQATDHASPDKPVSPSPTYVTQPDDPSCPKCGSCLLALDIPLLCTTNHVKFAPNVAVCSNPSCATKYTHISLRKSCMFVLLNVANVTIESIDTEMKLDMAAPRRLPRLSRPPPADLLAIQVEVQRYISCTAHGMPFTTTLHAENIAYIKAAAKRTLALVSVLEHKFGHHGSCFKKGKIQGCRHIYCRYSYPKERQAWTYIGKDMANWLVSDGKQ